MANERVSQLPKVASAASADLIYAVQGGISVQETIGQILALAHTTNSLNHAGNPNGSVAGTVYQTCWDTTNNFLWVCTTSGSASTAVWKPCVGTMTNGQLVIGSTGSVPSKATLTAGSGVTITNAAGSITIAASGGGLTVNNVTGTSATMSVNSLNISNNGALVTLTLPATAAVGDIVEVKGSGAGGWLIAQNAGDIIHVGSSATTTGVGGSAASTNRYDCVTLCCIVANNEWVASGVQSAGLTIV